MSRITDERNNEVLQKGHIECVVIVNKVSPKFVYKNVFRLKEKIEEQKEGSFRKFQGQ